MPALSYSTVFVALAEPEGIDLIAFYAALFGQAPRVSIPGVYAEFALSGLRLGIFKPKLAHESEFMGRAGSMSLCLEVEQLETAMEHLKALGGVPLGEIMHTSHGRELYAYDPAGNRLILHQGYAFTPKPAILSNVM